MSRLLLASALALLSIGAAAAESTTRPDLTGIWVPDSERAAPWPASLPLTPAARSVMEKFDASSQDSTGFCMPFGTPRNMLQTQHPLQIVQTPQKLFLILQPDLANAEVRRIALDGSAMPASPEASWFGTSRGKWSGATLIIETIGLRDDSIITDQGLPHSDQLRVVERLTIVNDPQRGKVLVDDMELTDPAAYTAPIRARRYFTRSTLTDLPDASCVERKWIDKLWRDRLQEHAAAARTKAGGK